MWPEGDNLFPDLQIAIFSFEPRRGSPELPASIVFQQGTRKSCQLISLLFQTTERLSEFNYQPIKRCFFLFTGFDSVRIHIVWKIRPKGAKSLEHFPRMGCLIVSPQQQPFCCVPWVTGTMTCSWTLPRQLFAPSHRHTQERSARCVTGLWE